MELKLTAFFEPAPEGGYICGFEEMPDIFSQGETMEEAKTNLFEALQLVLEYHREEARKRATEDGVVRETFDLQPV